MTPFNRTLDFRYGEVATISPLVRRIIARNPSPFTFHGTGTYIVGHGEVAVIDPGPAIEAHVAAIRTALANETVTHILVTHTHRDHSPAAVLLHEATGAPTYGFGPHGSGRPDSGAEVEEGGDYSFQPHVQVRTGNTIEGRDWTFEAVHTPGHTSNHICYALSNEKALFCGDHVMGWSTTVVSPPDGDMRAYFESLRTCLARADTKDSVYYPTHGAPVDAPRPLVAALLAHRVEREIEIAACLRDRITTIPAMVSRIYASVPAVLHPAAARTVLSHLIHMVATGRAACDGPPRETSSFRLP
ncbi:MAG: MBL fold metallo-hydrolase [Alphaproteobacteria bacterium]|nr:MBL fold metallo-hydrolase [Alphaproteobacteria bacterium]